MNKKQVFLVVLILTIFLVGLTISLTGTTRYRRFVSSKEKWEKIQSERKESDNIRLNSISFNDYPLIVNQQANRLYYSYVENTNPTNPTVHFIGNERRLKLQIKDFLTKEGIEEDKEIEVMVYNNDSYHSYFLTVMKNPMIDIRYSEIINNTTRGEILVVDNQLNANQKIIKTNASITISNNQEIIISMRKKSTGRNDRENEISVFGITMDHEFKLRKKEIEEDSSCIVVDLFENEEYQGVYCLEEEKQEGE